MNSTMQSEQEQITQKTYYMLTRLHTWPEFSNHTASEGASANSLEAIHDGIHVYVTLMYSMARVRVLTPIQRRGWCWPDG